MLAVIQNDSDQDIFLFTKSTSAQYCLHEGDQKTLELDDLIGFENVSGNYIHLETNYREPMNTLESFQYSQKYPGHQIYCIREDHINGKITSQLVHIN